MSGKPNDIMGRGGEADADAPLTDQEFDPGIRGHASAPGSGRGGLVAGGFRCAIRNSGRFVARLATGRRAPDAATQSYLRVIARMPEAVAKALHDAT